MPQSSYNLSTTQSKSEIIVMDASKQKTMWTQFTHLSTVVYVLLIPYLFVDIVNTVLSNETITCIRNPQFNPVSLASTTYTHQSEHPIAFTADSLYYSPKRLSFSRLYVCYKLLLMMVSKTNVSILATEQTVPFHSPDTYILSNEETIRPEIILK